MKIDIFTNACRNLGPNTRLVAFATIHRALAFMCISRSCMRTLAPLGCPTGGRMFKYMHIKYTYL